MQRFAPLLIAVGVLSLAACTKRPEAPPTGATSPDVAITPAAPQSPTPEPSTTGTTPPTGPATPPSPTADGNGGATGSSGTSTGAQASAGGTVDGKAVYTQTCSMCHAAGVAGAPKLGDKADWGPRIAKGKDTLYQHAINGFQGAKGMMPPRGGSTRPDNEIKAAVDYMVSQAK